MHTLRYIFLIIPLTFFLLTCTRQQNPEKARPLPSPSSNLRITEQTEELYQSMMKTSGNTFGVYKAGAFDLQQVEAPKTFRELAHKLESDWAIPGRDFSHPIMKFLVAQHAKSPLFFKEGAVRKRNLKACFMAYSMLSGEVRTSTILTILKKKLGEDFSSYMDDQDLKIEWSDDSHSLILKAKDKLKTIAVESVDNQQPQYSQSVKPVVLTPKEIESMAKEYHGSVQVMDNALGRIKGIFVFFNSHLPYKTLLAICRSLDAHVNIVTLPQSQLMHYIDSHIKKLEQGTWEKYYTKSILSQQSHYASRFKNQIEFMCSEDSIMHVNEKRDTYIRTWKDLRGKIFGEEVNGHEQSLRALLKSDGIDLNRVSIITSQNLESRWARDYFLLGFTQKRKPLFLESSIQIIKRNETLARELKIAPELHGKWGIQDIHLPFEGGDIRAVGQSMFVGESTFEKGIDEIQRTIGLNGKVWTGSKLIQSTDRTEIALHVMKEYETLSGREFVLVGEGDTTRQSMMHIDMFLTFLPEPGKKPTVAVADMDETLRLLKGLSEEETNQIERSMLIASLHPDELNRTSPFWLYRGMFMDHDLIQILMHGGLPRYITAFQKSAFRKGLQQRLNAAATWFKERGYSVVRTPTAAPPLCYINYWSQRNGTAILETSQDNAFRVYNNVLVEMYVDNRDKLHRTVYMPQYGIIPLEKRLIEIYSNLGYRVVLVPFMWETACGRGALDCLTSEVRGPFKDKEIQPKRTQRTKQD